MRPEPVWPQPMFGQPMQHWASMHTAEAQVEAQLAEARRQALEEAAQSEAASRAQSEEPVRVHEARESEASRAESEASRPQSEAREEFQSSFWEQVEETCAIYASPAEPKRAGLADMTNRDVWRSPVINLAALESPLTESRPLAPLVMHKRGGGVYGSAMKRSASVDVFSPRQ